MTPDETISNADELIRTGKEWRRDEAKYWVLRAIYVKLCEMEKKLP